ncbi:MAG TPA: HlyD family efflux transporter periplasmic adaptor subunit [Gemmatimonadales bacterium]|nr:HlyD family efflux transporter periplasmic adaptor subunit [Gemmatimonadales bacterium]
MDIPRAKQTNKKPYIYGGAGIVAVAIVTVALSRLGPAAPSVDKSTVYQDTVRQGTMLLEVHGPGTLVPEQIRWVAAVTAGRVERKLVQPGTRVDSSTVLLELSNPDEQLQALDAENQLTQARANRVSLGATLENQRLTQQGVVAQAEADSGDAVRKATAAVALAKDNLISSSDLESARATAAAAAVKVRVERQRLTVMTESMQAQLATADSQVVAMRKIVEFRHRRLASMRVRAGADGVLQDLPVEEGQWVLEGATLAKVVQPKRLKAVLQIPEAQVRDVTLGQEAFIDMRTDTITGKVSRIAPAAVNGTVAVDVSLPQPLPRSARPDLTVDGTIEIAKLQNVLYVGRPAYGQENSTIGMFKVVDGGGAAVRVSVRLGRASVNTVEIKNGLKVGDVVILSDMSQWDAVDRVRLK